MFFNRMAKQNNHCQWLHANRQPLKCTVCEQCQGCLRFLDELTSVPDRWCLLPKESCTFMAVRFTRLHCTSLWLNHWKCLSMHLLPPSSKMDNLPPLPFVSMTFSHHSQVDCLNSSTNNTTLQSNSKGAAVGKFFVFS